jgi:hypothetical protein
MTLAVGDIMLDFSGYRPPGRDYSLIRKAGAAGILRYSAGAGNADSATAWKLCEENEIALATAAGLIFKANSEWTTTRITQRLVKLGHEEKATRGLEGRLRWAQESLVAAGGRARPAFDHDDVVAHMASAGSADGGADLAFWRSRKYNRGAGIAVSWDAYPDPAKFAAVDAYLTNYRTGLASYYVPDVYAGTGYLKHALPQKIAVVGWHPNAESWSGNDLPYQLSTRTAADRAAYVKRALAVTPASIIQTGNYWFDKSCDENLIVRTPVGSHQDAATPPPPPPPAPKPSIRVNPSTGDRGVDATFALAWGEGYGDITHDTHQYLVPEDGMGVMDRLLRIEKKLGIVK